MTNGDMCYFEPINLDDITTEPKDMERIAGVLRLYSHYADLKVKAMEARLTGRINMAQCLEATLEEIYKNMPEWAKW